MKVTKTHINTNTEVIRNGFSPDVTYRFQYENFYFEANTTNKGIEVYDSETHKYDYDEPTARYDKFHGNKPEFVNYVQDFLLNNNKV